MILEFRGIVMYDNLRNENKILKLIKKFNKKISRYSFDGLLCFKKDQNSEMIIGEITGDIFNIQTEINSKNPDMIYVKKTLKIIDGKVKKLY